MLADRDEISVTARRPWHLEPYWVVSEGREPIARCDTEQEADDYSMELRHQCDFGTFDGWASDDPFDMLAEAPVTKAHPKSVLKFILNLMQKEDSCITVNKREFAKALAKEINPPN